MYLRWPPRGKADSDGPMGLLERVRSSVGVAAWVRGTDYGARATLAFAERRADRETWMVRGSASAPFLAVVLYPRDESWECSCGADDETCAHVIAVVDHRARHPEAAPERAPPARPAYRLVVDGSDLRIARDLPAGAVRDEDDVALERILTGWWDRPGMPRRLLQDALHVLGRVSVTLAGRPVRVGDVPIRHRLVIEDAPGREAVKVRLARGVGIEEMLPERLVRVGDVVRPLAEEQLEPADRKRLVEGLTLAGAALDRFVLEDLPRWTRGLDADVRTARLPQVVDLPPHLAFEVTAGGGGVRVTARVAWGRPVVARLERGELRRLGDVIPRRDPDAERKVLADARNAGFTVDVPVERPLREAIAWVERLPRPVASAILEAAPQLRVARAAPTVRVEVQAGPDGALRVDVDAGGADPTVLLRAWQRGDALVPLLDGGWAPLPKAWLDAHGPALEELLAARDPKGNVAPAQAPRLVEALDALDAPLPPELGALRALAGHFDAIPDVEVPGDVRATLRPYQARGVAWMAWLRALGMGGILADDMGLGKTLQTLVHLRRAGGRALVVAPTSVLRNWAAEAARFVPGMRVCVYHGARRTMDPRADLVVTSYALLRLDLAALSAERWSVVVLDEAQQIKNAESQAAQAAFALEAEQRLALSGTPVENRLEELWSLVHFVNPGLLGGRRAFSEEVAARIADGDRHARDRLRRKVRPFLLRRLKRDVARELPPRTDVVLRCTLSGPERELYDRVAALARAEVQAMLEGGGTLQVLEVLLRMRQAACHPRLVPGTEGFDPLRSAKLDLLVETLGTLVEEGHRALVFSQWTSMLDLVAPALDAAGIGWTRLDGSTRDRAAVVADFERPDGPAVFLLSLKAGGTGLNLTAADYVIHLDPWWNPAVEDQATDRAHRIGQDRPVVSVKIVAEDTVEERILELQSRKRALVAAALDEEALARGVTREELAALFD